MAATTTLLGLVTPTQGTLSGTWGDTVNYGISDYVDIAIAGTLSFAGDGAITLANTTGSSSGNAITSTTAQYMVIRITGTQTVTKVITGPSYSKLYMVDHAGATSAVTFKAAGQTGVTVAVGEKCFVYYNGTDYVKVASSTGTGTVTSASVVTANGFAGTVATATTTPAITLTTSISGVLKGNGTAISAATAGTDYVAPSGALGTPSSGTLTNATGLPLTTGVTGTLPIANGGTGTTSTTFTNLTTNVTGILPAANGGTGVANNAASTLTISGSFATTLTVSGTTGVTLPTTGTLATLAGTETLTNKTIAYGSNTLTDVVGVTATQTLTNKTLTTPIISSISNTGTLTLPTSTDTLVGRATTDTLTNKTLTNPTLTTPVLGTPTSGNLTTCTADGTNKVGYLNIPLSGIKTTSYTLVAGDVGKFVELGTSGTIVVPASVFTTGDAISIFNNTSGSISCTCSAVTTVYKGGTDADIGSFSVTTRGVATILFITATVAVVTGNLA